MKLKVKVLKRIISVLCAISMSTSFVITSAGAIDTNNAEAAFSMQYMNILPKPGEDNFDKFSGKYERNEIENNQYTNTLQKNIYYVKYPKDNDTNFRTDREEIDEKQVYEDIKKTVADLKQKVKDRTPYEGIDDETAQIGIQYNQISKHYKMPEKMRLAKAIYRWVAKKIPYDHDSLKRINGESLRKPQDALYVFAKKTGVCAGKANLANLMMRIAGIPSAVIVSRTHAFNAIYLKDTVNNREGWTLIDSTWGATSSDQEMQAGKKAKVKTFKDILEISWHRFVDTGFEEVNNEYVERINNINRLHNHASLKDSKEYTEKFYTLCENLFEQYKNEYTNNINILKNGKNKQAEDRIKAIVDDMNQRIKAEIDKLNQQYNNIAKFESFKIIFVDHNVKKPLEDTLAVEMKVDFPLQDAMQVAEKLVYWSDKRKEFFPGFYDKSLSFEYANENIIDKRAHKFEQIVFGNWFDNFEAYKREVMDLNINGVKYEVLGSKEGKSDGFELTGDINNPLENVVISPDLVGFGLKFKIGSGIKSLTLKGYESIDWSSSRRLKSVDVTESKKYMAENGELYKIKEDGSKGEKLIVPHGIKFIDNRNVAFNEEKVKEEYEKVLNELAAKNDEFRSWRDNDENRGKVVEDPKVRSKRIEAIALYRELYNKFDVKKAEQFIKVAKEAIDMMDKFKTDYEKQQVEQERLEKEKLQNQEKLGKAKDKLIENINEYDNWLKSKNKQDDYIVNQKRDEMTERYNNIINNPTNENVTDFEESVEDIIDSINSSKRIYFWDESNKKHKDLVNKYKEFYNWVNSENVSEEKYKDVLDKKTEAVDFFKSNCNFNIIGENDMERFLTLSKEAIDMMDKFKADYENEKVNIFRGKIEADKKAKEEQARLERERKAKEEQERLEREKNIKSEYKKVLNELDAKNKKFRAWRDSDENKGKVVEDPKVRSKRLEAIALYRELDNKFDVEKAEQFIKVAKEAIDMMNNFKEEYDIFRGKIEADKKAKEEQARLERERKAKEEQERLERERKAKEEQERLERERKAKEEQERLERERKAKEEQERLEKKYQEVLKQYIEKIKYINLNFVMKGIKANWNELIPNKKDIQDIKNKLAVSFDLDEADKCIKFLESAIENMDKFIKEKEEQVRLEREKNIKSEYEKVLNELDTKNNEFRSWRDSDENKGKVVEDPQVRSKRLEVIALYRELDNKFDVEKAEQFIKLAKEAIDMMDKFKTDYEKQQVE